MKHLRPDVTDAFAWLVFLGVGFIFGFVACLAWVESCNVIR